MPYALTTLPLEARAEIVKTYKHNPYVTTFIEGQITEYLPKNKRNFANVGLTINVYVNNLTQLKTFLDERNGFKPFVLPQDNQSYVCTEYSITYGEDIEKGTIQMTLVKVTN